MDSTNVLNRLRKKHQIDDKEGVWFGVDALSSGNNEIADMYEKFVWEPEDVRINVLSAACEAACTVLSID